MNDLDKKVLTIFNILLFGDVNYYSHRDNYGGMIFTVNGNNIRLEWFRKHAKDRTTNTPISIEYFRNRLFNSWDVCPSDSSEGFRFYITIGEHGRQLVVPDLDRIEEAKALTKIEQLANEAEHQVLDGLIDILEEDCL